MFNLKPASTVYLDSSGSETLEKVKGSLDSGKTSVKVIHFDGYS